jgi:hypothetical protein
LIGLWECECVRHGNNQTLRLWCCVVRQNKLFYLMYLRGRPQFHSHFHVYRDQLPQQGAEIRKSMSFLLSTIVQEVGVILCKRIGYRNGKRWCGRSSAKSVEGIWWRVICWGRFCANMLMLCRFRLKFVWFAPRSLNFAPISQGLPTVARRAASLRMLARLGVNKRMWLTEWLIARSMQLAGRRFGTCFTAGTADLVRALRTLRVVYL